MNAQIKLLNKPPSGARDCASACQYSRFTQLSTTPLPLV
ncbi:MAG: hypothetical protein OFPII_22410 [Osedax symbiont Rs1]|nr:MAG: hypothetical protein OFPII_22410 [Osedax symbiont Rs1]